MSDEVASAFQDVFDKRKWGEGESVSGTGSSRRATADLVPQLIQLIGDQRITSMVDAPCGDFNWISPVAKTVRSYQGIDIVPDVVAQAKANAASQGFPSEVFHVGNIISDDLPEADLYLVRDCIVHLQFEEGVAAIQNVRQRAKWILATTFPDIVANKQVATGRWRPLNLQLSPYNLPTAVHLIVERPNIPPNAKFGRKCLGLWRGS